jgi:hypothetical protein
MPSIDSNTHTLLQGLSDFWTRFYKDTEELNALYRGSEVLLAQTYLDMLSAFLNISVVETPLFNTELFKLVTFREDLLVYDAGLNPSGDRYRFDLPDNLVEAHILQNKVVDPTASMEVDAGYEIDEDELEFRFWQDPSGRPETVISTVTAGHLLAYGIAANLKRFYVTDGAPFANAKAGYWLRVQNSGVGNNNTYRIARVLDSQAVLLQEGTSTTLTTPDPNSGSLTGVLLDSEFSTVEGFAHRIVEVSVGGSFDDATLRGATEIESWYPTAPVGLGVRKGDILRVLDIDAVASVPTDFDIVLVRHDKLYFSEDTPVNEDATGVTKYVVLREGPDPHIIGEVDKFVQTTTGAPKSGAAGQLLTGNVLQVGGAPFTGLDRQRFVTLTGCGDITWTAALARDGTLTRTAGMSTPLARAFAGSRVTVSGSIEGNNGTFYIDSLTDPNDCVLQGGTFALESGLSLKLEDITNDGTYRVRKVPAGNQLELALPISYPDPNNGSIGWTVHDGYQLPLSKSRLVQDTVEVFSAVGGAYTGGSHRATEGSDYEVKYESGTLLQIGYHAGTWGLGSPGSSDVYVNYTWLMEVFAEVTTGNGTLSSADITVAVNEAAAWAPDVKVDRFNLYNNYGYLINRFDASSEQYREFIRGVFQLYILGPTLERLESALNVIAGFPVIRDDGEVFQGYDDTSDSDYNIVTTLRPNGDTATYAYPKSSALAGDLALRADISDPGQWPSNVGVLTFESFEPLTLGFQVSDHVQDPSWWTDIIIPSELMPNQTIGRRRTVGALIENVIGAWDLPLIGDPGFFIGADDEGVVPSFIGTFPAKRRKMANVVMNTFLKWNVFFVRFDETAIGVLNPSFINDLVDLILVAKPGYRLMFIEPLNNFEDVMLLTEDDVEINARIPLDDPMVLGEDSLTLQSLSWQIGDVWAPVPPVTGQALATADGATIPNGGAAISLGAPNVITKRVYGPAHVEEDIDYDINYATGHLTPKTVWPAGAYTIDLRCVDINPAPAGWTNKFTGYPSQSTIPVSGDTYVGGTLQNGFLDFSDRVWVTGTPTSPVAWDTLASMSTDATKILRLTCLCGGNPQIIGDPNLIQGAGVAIYGPNRDDAYLSWNEDLYDFLTNPTEGKGMGIENGTPTSVSTWSSSGGDFQYNATLFWNPTGSPFTIPDAGFGSHVVPANSVSAWAEDTVLGVNHLFDRTIDAGVTPDRAGVYLVVRDNFISAAPGVTATLVVDEWGGGSGGDTMPFTIGCPDPKKVRPRQELYRNGTILGTSLPYQLYDPYAGFEAALHEGKFIRVKSVSQLEGLHQVLRVIDSTHAVLRPDRLHSVIGGLSDVANVTWGFPSEEPYDGVIYYASGEVRFVSATGLFRSWDAGRYLRIVGATNAVNNRRHKIVRVISMSRIVLEGERPLFIKVT